MTDPLTWLIIALFYAPLHYLVPVLVAVIRHPDSAARRQAVRSAVLDCTVSMAVAFGLVLWLAESHLTWAMLALLAAMGVPYLRVLAGTGAGR